MKKYLSKIKLFLKQFPFIFPSGIIYNAQAYITKAEEIKEWYSLRNASWYKERFQSEWLMSTIPQNLINTDYPKFRKNRLVKTYSSSLYFFTNVFIKGDNGIVLSGENKIFNEFVHNFNVQSTKNSFVLKPFACFSNKINREYRLATLLCSPSSTNYYHWMFDTLPRLKLLEDFINVIEIFIVPKSITESQVRMLTYFGVTESKLYKIDATEKIWFENIFIPSLPGSEGLVPQWSIDFLQKAFIKDVETSNKKKYYFTRKDVEKRKIINEDEVISILKKYDFEIVTMSELSFEEQIGICRNASIIVSYHGAALTNILFADNCKVLEIFSPDYFRTDCYYTLSAQLGFKYWYLVGDCNSEKGNRLEWGDIIVNTSHFEKTLEDIIKN